MNENKMKALREMRVAQIMMLNEEYICAREKLLTAQQLYPALDDIDSMLTVCDILLLAAGIKLSGCSIDNYWVLELLKPSVTYYDVCSHYQKLLTLLLPIRDEFPHTDLALEILHDSFSKHRPVLAGHKYMFDRASSSKTLYIGSEKNVSVGVNTEKSGNFEPLLLHCCNTDEQDGLITHQATHLKSNTISSPETMAVRKSNQEFYNFEDNRKLEFIRAEQIWAAHFQDNVQRNYRYALINYNEGYQLNVTWLKPITVSPSDRRWSFAGLPVGCGSFDVNPVINDLVSPMVLSHKCSPVHAGTKDQFEIYPRKGEIWALYNNWNPDEWANNPQNLKGFEFHLVELFSDFSKVSGADVACLTKVDGFRSVFQRQTIEQNPIIKIPPNHLYIFSHNIPAYRLIGGDKFVNTIFELDQLALPDALIHDTDTEIILKHSNLDALSGFIPMKYLSPLESSAEGKFPKLTCSLNDFSVGQVWAIYCGKDNMPRPYIQIDNVISENQVCVTFLDPVPVFHLDIEWKKKNLPIACGLFELSRTSDILKMSHFSHPMKYGRSIFDSHFIIYPKKGEVWAVYKGWNEEWEHSDYKDCHSYIAEILSDFSDENGMRIARLVEVDNNLTFFCRQQYDGFDIACAVSQAEIFSFSHQIPAFKVKGIEMYGIPEDSWHLDHNALPHKDLRPF